MSEVRIGEIAEVIRGVAYDKAQATRVPAPGFAPILRAGNIQRDLIYDSDLVYVPNTLIASRQFLKEDDIVMCMSSGSADVVGKVAICKSDWAGSFGAFCGVVRPERTAVHPSYLFHVLGTPAFRAWTAKSLGANIKNIRKSELEAFSVKLPPLDEQRRIAAILDKADAIRRKRQQTLALADDVLRSAFLEMFGAPVPNPHDWDRWPIGDCVTAVDAGWSAKGLDRPAAVSEVGVLKISAVTSGRYRPSENKAVLDVDAGRNLVVPRQGDFLFSRANTRELVAATCIVDRTVENVFLPDKLWRIRLDERRIKPEYLKFVLSDPVFRALLCAKATGTSGSMLNISKGKLLETLLPLPPIDRQRDFTVLVQKSEALRNQFVTARSAADDLFASLSQRAFRGDLSPASVPA